MNSWLLETSPNFLLLLTKWLAADEQLGRISSNKEQQIFKVKNNKKQTNKKTSIHTGRQFYFFFVAGIEGFSMFSYVCPTFFFFECSSKVYNSWENSFIFTKDAVAQLKNKNAYFLAKTYKNWNDERFLPCKISRAEIKVCEQTSINQIVIVVFLIDLVLFVCSFWNVMWCDILIIWWASQQYTYRGCQSRLEIYYIIQNVCHLCPLTFIAGTLAIHCYLLVWMRSISLLIAIVHRYKGTFLILRWAKCNW